VADCLDTAVESFELFVYDAHLFFSGLHKLTQLRAFRDSLAAILKIKVRYCLLKLNDVKLKCCFLESIVPNFH